MATESPLDMIYRAHRELCRLEEEPRDYGTGRLFYASEIHALERVGEAPYINLTSLAADLGVSKSAVSKVVAKLIDAGCLEKTKAEDNDKEVLFLCTAEGAKALRGHAKFRKAAFGPLREIEARLGRAQAESVTAFLSSLCSALEAVRPRC
jgi:DNA-binding MarR family transcriptional regulator